MLIQYWNLTGELKQNNKPKIDDREKENLENYLSEVQSRNGVKFEW